MFLWCRITFLWLDLSLLETQVHLALGSNSLQHVKLELGWIILYIVGYIWYFSNVQRKLVSKCISRILNSKLDRGFLNIIAFTFLLFPSLPMSFSSTSDHLVVLLLSVLHWPFHTTLSRELPVSAKLLIFFSWVAPCLRTAIFSSHSLPVLISISIHISTFIDLLLLSSSSAITLSPCAILA